MLQTQAAREILEECTPEIRIHHSSFDRLWNKSSPINWQSSHSEFGYRMEITLLALKMLFFTGYFDGYAC